MLKETKIDLRTEDNSVKRGQAIKKEIKTKKIKEIRARFAREFADASYSESVSLFLKHKYTKFKSNRWLINGKFSLYVTNDFYAVFSNGILDVNVVLDTQQLNFLKTLQNER